MKLSDAFRFGKWKGTTLENVLAKDFGYIQWLISENVIQLDNDAYKVYEELL